MSGMAGLDEAGEHRRDLLVPGADVAFDQPVHARPVRLALLGDDAVQLWMGGGEVDELADEQLRHGQLVDAAQPSARAVSAWLSSANRPSTAACHSSSFELKW